MKLIGISGRKRVGKDTIAQAIIRELGQFAPNLKVIKYALADKIKQELNEWTIPKFGVDCTTMEGEQKEIFRHLLIGYGQTMRAKTENRHWRETLAEQISVEKPDIAIISDIRFAENDQDELSWIQNSGGKLIHIKRFTVTNGKKVYLPFAGEDEKRNDPKLEKAADYNINWETAICEANPENESLLKELANEHAKKFILNNVTEYIT